MLSFKYFLSVIILTGLLVQVTLTFSTTVRRRRTAKIGRQRKEQPSQEDGLMSKPSSTHDNVTVVENEEYNHLPTRVVSKNILPIPTPKNIKRSSTRTRSVRGRRANSVRRPTLSRFRRRSMRYSEFQERKTRNNHDREQSLGWASKFLMAFLAIGSALVTLTFCMYIVLSASALKDDDDDLGAV